MMANSPKRKRPAAGPGTTATRPAQQGNGKKSVVKAAPPKPKMTIRKQKAPMDRKFVGGVAVLVVAVVVGLVLPSGPAKKPLRSTKATPTKRPKYEVPFEYQRPAEGCQMSIMDVRKVMEDAAELLKGDRQSAEAFAKIDETIACGPANVGEVKVNAAHWRSRAGQHGAAVALFDEMWLAAPGDARVDFGGTKAGSPLDSYCNSLVDLGRLQDAADVLNRTLSLPADDDDVEWEYNWKTFQVRTDDDDEDVEETDGDAAPEEVEEGA